MKLDSSKVRILYARKGWAQQELAERAGLSRQGLNAALQRGSAVPSTVLKIANALQVKPHEIILSANGGE